MVNENIKMVISFPDHSGGLIIGLSKLILCTKQKFSWIEKTYQAEYPHVYFKMTKHMKNEHYHVSRIYGSHNAKMI